MVQAVRALFYNNQLKEFHNETFNCNNSSIITAMVSKRMVV